MLSMNLYVTIHAPKQQRSHKIGRGLRCIFIPDGNSSFFFQPAKRRRKVIICSNKLQKSFLSAPSLPRSTRKSRLYNVRMNFFFSFVLFSQREEIGKVTICGNELQQSSLSQSLTGCALNEQQNNGLYYLERKHSYRLSIYKSLYAQPYYGLCTLTKFDWLT